MLFPGTNGGANWGGASFDPDTHTLYVNSMDVGMLFHMVKRPEGSEIPYPHAGLGLAQLALLGSGSESVPEAAVGLSDGHRSGHGRVPLALRAGRGGQVAREAACRPPGAPNLGGSLVTAGGLVFIGATNDSRFRAFDKDTGKEMWVTRLPASAHATPMTFAGERRAGSSW